LEARLKEQEFLHDARVKVAVASLTKREIEFLSEIADDPRRAHGWEIGGNVLSRHEAAIMRLLDKRVLSLAGKSETGVPMYKLTDLGRSVAQIAKSGLRVLRPQNSQ
jgi:hypothetical protein